MTDIDWKARAEKFAAMLGDRARHDQAALDEALAKAWEHGYRAGETYARAVTKNPAAAPLSNPYRTEEDR